MRPTRGVSRCCRPLITSKQNQSLTLKSSAGRPMTPKATCLPRSSSLTAAELFRSRISIESQQASSDERFLDFSQDGRVQFHVGDGLPKQLAGNGEPLVPGCRCGPLSEAIMDRPFKAQTIKDRSHQSISTRFEESDASSCSSKSMTHQYLLMGLSRLHGVTRPKP